MPEKNCIKIYEEGGFYHIYNRGVEKRDIFLDSQDHSVFLSYLQYYLSSPDEEADEYPSKKLKNYSVRIDLLCYCLMPNHFHLLIRQSDSMAIADFMRSLLTRYSKYFNRKYKRVGSLFESRYKAVQVLTEEQLVYLSKYIHRNPSKLVASNTSKTVFEVLVAYKYSSLRNYLGLIIQSWVKHDLIGNLFSTTNMNLSYESFVSDSDFSLNLDSVTIDGHENFEDCLRSEG